MHPRDVGDTLEGNGPLPTSTDLSESTKVAKTTYQIGRVGYRPRKWKDRTAAIGHRKAV